MAWLGTVKMKTPKGKTILINGDQLLEYTAKGYTRIGGKEAPITLKTETPETKPALTPAQMVAAQANGS